MSENETCNEAFLGHLNRFRSSWRRGLVFALVLRVTGWAVSAAAVYFLADFFLALGETERFWLNVMLPLGLVASAVPEAMRIARLGMGEAAARVDRVGKHRRQEVLTAWELRKQFGVRRLDAAFRQPGLTGCSVQDGGSSPAEEKRRQAAALQSDDELLSFLVQRSVEEARDKLAALECRVVRPHDLLARGGRLLGLQLIGALVLIRLCGIEAFLTIGPRMLWPGRDIPPYSHYRFDVRPASPVILYGGSAEISATIHGAPVEDQVWMLTRRVGQKARRAACFQEGGERYAQRLENVTAPVEFCFAVGRARSHWHSVDLQLQPQVVLTRVRLVSPPYTRLPVREFPAGQEDVAGVRGTKVTLTLTSNRPLKDGTLTLERRHAAKGSEQVITGRLVSEHSASFEWTLQEDADAKATLRDVRGTPTAEPFIVHQKLIPDELPKTALTEPPEFSMATPSAVIKVAGNVEDDFGIEQIDWIRTVVGFNDRGITLRRGSEGTRSEFETDLNLGSLGVEPGQVLEFYAEALDNNPYLPGIGASDVVRVKIIGEDEYAEMLRNREALEQFTARYELATESMKLVIESLEELQGLVLWKNPDKAKLAETVKKVLDAHTAAEKVFRQLATDFAAYDSEKTLKKTAGEILGKLAQNKTELQGMREPGAENTAKVEGMLKRLGAEAESLMKQGVNAELMAKIARVMDAAARFNQIVRHQETLVRRLKQRYGGKVNAADLPFLSGYGEDQGEVVLELTDFVTNVTAAVAALPKEMEEMQADTLAFVAALQQSGASNHMGQAVIASRNTDAPRTYREAQLALECLNALLQSGSSGCTNQFAGMCRGKQPSLSPGDMKKTLQEMFKSLCRKRGVGQSQGKGSGVGTGGDGGGESGQASEGYSELGTPVYGPGRSAMGKAGEGAGERGDGRGPKVRDTGHKPEVVERLPGSDLLVPSGEAVQFERLPSKYRDAVKRYFQNGREGGER